MRDVPRELAKLVHNYKWEQILLGHSRASTYVLRGSLTNLYVKIQPLNSGESLVREKDRLAWLCGRLPVPEVLHFDQDEAYEYLLISEIRGINASSKVYEVNPRRLMHLLGEGLREIHSLDVKQCPFDQTLGVKLSEARVRLENGEVDEDDFDAGRKGLRAALLFEELLSNKPSVEDVVFTHGDYCLPNIIVHEDRISGFIDWGRAGTSDRYQDLALAVRSIIRNFGEVYVNAFLTAYGIQEQDQAKMYYYQLLDEFF